ncbi:MAG: hypothetical protein PHE55_16340 [Methylococcaceae bacterium]|nr:hypothetical protein [Methylococcaceae bacterium]
MALFEASRIFSHRNCETGRIEWFFHAREGVIGPYESVDKATQMMVDFIETCKKLGSDGGRSEKGKPQLSLEQEDSSQQGVWKIEFNDWH